MRRFVLILCLLLCAFQVRAGLIMSTRGPVEDTCETPGQLMSWHCEDLDVDNEIGCSILGDTVWQDYGDYVELNGTTVSDYDYACKNTGGYERFQLDLTQNQPNANGTIWFDMYITVWDDYKMFVQYGYNSNNNIMFQYKGTSGASDLYIINRRSSNDYTIDCDSDLANTTWYRVKYEWDSGAGSSQEHKVVIYTLDSSTPVRQVTGTQATCGPEDDLAYDFSSTPIFFKVAGDGNAQVYIDVVRLYDTEDL